MWNCAQLVDRVPEQRFRSRVRVEEAPVRVADERRVRRLRVQLAVVPLAARQALRRPRRFASRPAALVASRLIVSTDAWSKAFGSGLRSAEDAAGRAVVVDRREHDRAGAGRQAALHLRALGRAQDGDSASAQALDSERLVDRQRLVEQRSVGAGGDAEVRERRRRPSRATRRRRRAARAAGRRSPA